MKHITKFLTVFVFAIAILLSSVNVSHAYTHSSTSGWGSSSGSSRPVTIGYFWLWTTDQAILEELNKDKQTLIQDNATRDNWASFNIPANQIGSKGLAVLTANGYNRKYQAGNTCQSAGPINKVWISWVLGFAANSNSNYWTPNTGGPGGMFNLQRRQGQLKICTPWGPVYNEDAYYRTNLTQELKDIGAKDGYRHVVGTLYWKNSNDILSVIWDNDPWEEVVEGAAESESIFVPIVTNAQGATPLTTLNTYCEEGKVCVENGNGKTINWNDLKNEDTWNLLKENNNAVIEGSYTSVEGEKQFSHDYSFDIIRLNRIRTYKRRKSTGEIKDEQITFKTEKVDTKTFNASWVREDDIQDYVKLYRPYDLNTESVVTDFDFRNANYTNVLHPTNSNYGTTKWNGITSNDKVIGNLLMTIDSELNPKQAKKPLLDNNDPVGFKVNFANNQFGIPTAAQGGFDLQNTYNDNGVLGVQYYEPKLYVGVKDWYTNGNGDINKKASLQIEGENEFNKEMTYVNKQPFNKRWKFRSLSTGEYALGSSKIADYWTLEYRMNELYEYGAKYHFKVKVTFSGNSYTITHEGFEPSSTTKVKVNDVSLYRDHDIRYVQQPVLRGKFIVKTVGGYNP